MKRGIVIAGALLIGMVARAEPPEGTIRAAGPSAAASASPATFKLLDLRRGDLRKYMTPEEFRALSEPLNENDTVIVKADAPLLPMKSALDVPGGLIAPFWALAHPTQAWRLFVPDPRVRAEYLQPPASKIPPPIFRWGP